VLNASVVSCNIISDTLTV